MGSVAGRYRGPRSLGTTRVRQSATGAANPVSLKRSCLTHAQGTMNENTYPEQLTPPQQMMTLELGGMLLYSWQESQLNFPALVLQAVFTATEDGLQLEHGAFSGTDSMQWYLGEMEEDIMALADRLWKLMGRDWKTLVITIDPVTRFCDQTFFRGQVNER